MEGGRGRKEEGRRVGGGKAKEGEVDSRGWINRIRGGASQSPTLRDEGPLFVLPQKKCPLLVDTGKGEGKGEGNFELYVDRLTNLPQL